MISALSWALLTAIAALAFLLWMLGRLPYWG